MADTMTSVASAVKRTGQRDVPETTMMLRNIPFDATVDSILRWLDIAGFKGLYDYVHLPGDDMSRGYAFINFSTPKIASLFRSIFNGRPLQCSGILKVGSVLTSKGHGFRYNLQNRVNVHGTRIFFLISGSAVAVPRDATTLDSIIIENQTATEKIAAALKRCECDDSDNIENEIGSTSPPKSPQELLDKLRDSLDLPVKDSFTTSNLPLSTTSPTTTDPLIASSPTSLNVVATDNDIIFLPRALAALGEFSFTRKLLTDRMKWEIREVENCSELCECAEEMMARNHYTTETKRGLAVCATYEDLIQGVETSEVLKSFLIELLFKVDVPIIIKSPSPSSLESPVVLPPDFDQVKSRLKVARNLFDLSNTIRKSYSSFISHDNPSSSSTPPPSMNSTTSPKAATGKSTCIPSSLVITRGLSSYPQFKVGDSVSVVSVSETLGTVVVIESESSSLLTIPLEHTNFFDVFVRERRNI